MQITLTREQWGLLVPLVKHGARAERSLGVPLELKNNDQCIELDENEVKITLGDS